MENLAQIPCVRDHIFISHATPQDNAIAVWLASKLRLAGFKVWVDADELLGGEKCWDVITDIIHNKTNKVLLLTSSVSIQKPGVRREIGLAKEAEMATKIADFIIPLRIDAQIAFEKFPDSIQEYIGIDFSANWATGLAQLIKKLNKGNTPKTGNQDSALEAALQAVLMPNSKLLVDVPEMIQTNWYFIKHFPEQIRIFQIGNPADEIVTDEVVRERLAGFHRPFSYFQGLLVSFANFQEYGDLLSDFQLKELGQCSVKEFLQQGFKSERSIKVQDAHNIVSNLARKAWDLHSQARGLQSYDFSDSGKGWWRLHNPLEGNWVGYTRPGAEKPTRCLLVGKEKENFWHFSIEAKPYLSDIPRFVIQSHVLCTSNGTKLLDNKKMVKARKQTCGSWFNKEWRDKIVAFISLLKDEETIDIILPVSSTDSIVVSSTPHTLSSQKSLAEPIKEYEMSELVSIFKSDSSTGKEKMA